LVIAAGLSTAIGSSAVFFPALAKLGNRRNLASALGLSAGVMIYISLVDIFQKAIVGFEEAGHD
jgi:ZIP family zinc transporter